MKTKLSREEKKRLAIVIAFASLLILGVSALWWFTTGRPYRELLRDTEQKTYTPTPITAPDTDTGTQAGQQGRSEVETPQTPGTADTVSEAEPPNPINTAETPDTEAPIQEDSTDAAPSHTDHSAEDQMMRDALEEGRLMLEGVEARLKRTDALLEKTDILLKEGISRLASDLKEKSIEEQRAILKKTKAELEGLSDLMPPELQGVLTPEMKDQAWRNFLDALAKEGYTPPEGF